MSQLSPRMLKLLKELLEYPFIIEYTPGKGDMIAAVDALSRAPMEEVSTLSQDPLDLQFHLINRDRDQPPEASAHCWWASTVPALKANLLGDPSSCGTNPDLVPLFDTVAGDEQYISMVTCVESCRKQESYQGEDERPIKLWGQSTFEVLSIIRDSKKRPLFLKNSFQVVVPSPAVSAILDKLDCVHNGKARAMYLAIRSYWWPFLKADIMAHCGRPRFRRTTG